MPSVIGRLAARELVNPAASRALRATAAFMLPVLLGAAGRIGPTEAVLAGFAGHALAGLDVRGAYSLRLSLLLAMSGVLTGSAWLGAQVGGSLAWTVAATGLIGLGAAAWRHGLGEYGPAVASSAALLFFIALGSPEVPPATVALATLAGCLLCLALHALFWPFLAQHPLRRAVAASWTALADLAEALPARDDVRPEARQERVSAREHDLRAALDRAKEVLAHAPGSGLRPLIWELREVNVAAAHLGIHLSGLDSSLERLLAPPGPGPLAASFRSFLAALVNTSRSAALAVVSHQAGHFVRFEVRLRRLHRLLRVLRERVAAKVADPAERAHLEAVLAALEADLRRLPATLLAVIERAQERGPISFELFDLQAWSLRPLASALNFSLRVDPALVRYALRLAVMLMAGCFAWRHWHLPHGYWIPLCVMVVLQPDYGATRARATQRVVGTIAGSLLGSLLLALHLPLGVLLAATAAVCWAFTYQLSRSYARAVFYITLMVVLQFEAAGPVTVGLTVSRTLETLAGCLLALLGALTFWPMWERDRFPPLLAAALRANRAYLAALVRGFSGAAPDPKVSKARRAAQRANSLVFSSLNRMAGDPDVKREGIERHAALANHNVRITRGLTAAGVHLHRRTVPDLAGLAAPAGAALEALAEVVEGADPGRLAEVRAALEQAVLPEAEAPQEAWVAALLDQVGNELSAMLLEFEGDA